MNNSLPYTVSRLLLVYPPIQLWTDIERVRNAAKVRSLIGGEASNRRLTK